MISKFEGILLKERMSALTKRVEMLEKAATGQSIPCPRCNGEGKISGEYTDSGGVYSWGGVCPLCNETGRIMEWDRVKSTITTGLPSTAPTLGTALLKASGHKILPDGTIGESGWKKEVK